MTAPSPTPTPNAATTTRPERSSRRAARKSPLGWLPWALLGLLGLLLAATLLVINAVDDDGPDGPAGDSLGQVGSNGSGLDGEDGNGQIAGTESDSDSSPDSGSSTDGDADAEGGTDAGGSADAGAGAGAGTDAGTGAAALTADGEDLIAASGGSLSDRAGQSVTGTAKVESVVSDEGFWVGSSTEQRVFVFLTPAARRSQGESGFQVTAGQTVQLSGALTALSAAPEAAEGVTADEGRSQLDAQGVFISADAVTLA